MAPVTPERFLASVMLDSEHTSASGGRRATVKTGVSKQIKQWIITMGLTRLKMPKLSMRRITDLCGVLNLG